MQINSKKSTVKLVKKSRARTSVMKVREGAIDGAVVVIASVVSIVGVCHAIECELRQWSVGEASMTGRLVGRVALISGAARGQGAVEARMFVEEGARVVLGDVIEDELRATADAINATHPRSATAVVLDVTRPDQWMAAVAVAEREFGGLH